MSAHPGLCSETHWECSLVPRGRTVQVHRELLPFSWPVCTVSHPSPAVQESVPALLGTRTVDERLGAVRGRLMGGMFPVSYPLISHICVATDCPLPQPPCLHPDG